ncbi:hypothetical protein PS2_99 [Serratia phage PS2]|uniref:Uncharacterized protein n=1 Tax=Serratia phage PS2 TaxID=1481112 RepID=A0A023W695_9CAUD|nr:hypothetical protein FF83_gp099 [Serratia phage PS2]AHY25346.1 hypothetical protein PS2_99 [Serratia phage PS2]
MKLINEIRQVTLEYTPNWHGWTCGPQQLKVSYNESLDSFCFEHDGVLLFIDGPKLQNPGEYEIDEFNFNFDISVIQAMDIMKMVWEWIHP